MGGDSGSDDDYMSDKFLNPPVKPTRLETLSKSAKQTISRQPVASLRVAPKEKQMDIKRNEGLKRRIGEDNIGYKLLMKMGFTGDGGIGKKSGLSEPIPIEIISGRKGLGLHNIENKRKEALVVARQQRDLTMSAFQSEFRASMALRFRMERVQRQLSAARWICQRLDMARSLEKPIDMEFWPPNESKAKLFAHSEAIRRQICRSDPQVNYGKRQKRHNEANDKEKVDTLAELDEHHGYHDSVPEIESDEEEYCDIDAAQHGPLESRCVVILSRLSTYLRETHFYCFWCGEQYPGIFDLEANCPGPAEEDHG